MADRKLYGVVESPSTMRALASLFEHELDFEFANVDLKAGEHKKEPLISFNPFGQVPIFQDGDLIIYESRTIMRTISHSYPKPGKEQIYVQAKMQGIPAMWVDVEDHQFDPPSSKLIMELLHKPKNGLMPDEATVALEEAKLARVLDVYEERLMHSKYLGGDKFTSADLTHLPNIHYLLQTPTKRLFDRRPHVGAWCAAITSRPAWKKVIKMVDAANKK